MAGAEAGELDATELPLLTCEGDITFVGLGNGGAAKGSERSPSVFRFRSEGATDTARKRRDAGLARRVRGSSVVVRETL